jgi:hypothetical protein
VAAAEALEVVVPAVADSPAAVGWVEVGSAVECNEAE